MASLAVRERTTPVPFVEGHCKWCGEALPEDRYVNKETCDSSCRAAYSAWNTAQSGAGRGSGEKPLRSAGKDARAPIPASTDPEKKRWVGVAELAILDHFRESAAEPIHADDLDGLLPTEYRRAISDAFRNSVNKGLIVACGERASKVPSRNSAKSKEYRLTEKGVEAVRALKPPPSPPPSPPSTSPYSPDNDFA